MKKEKEMAEKDQSTKSEKEEKKSENLKEEAKKENATSEKQSDSEKKETDKNPSEDAKAESPKEEKKEPTLEEKYEALQKENADLKDQLLRRAADFDNYRKRMIKEKAETAEYANANLLGDLLDSLDNFDRTVEASSTATDVKSIADGIKMINNSLVKMLEEKYGLKCYGEVGDEFNPEEHEAIGRTEEEGAEKETLKQVYLKGYKLKDKVIRHAKVMVSVPKK